MPEIQFALSAHVIMKMSSFMIPPHLLFFVIVHQTFSPVDTVLEKLERENIAND